MSNTFNVLVPVLGGTALMLGLAYGITARDYRAGEIDVAMTRAAEATEREEGAMMRLSAVQDEISALQETAAAQTAEIAALKAEIAAQAAAAQQALEQTPEQTAESPEPVAKAEGTPETSADEDVADASLFGDPDRGAQIFRQCTGCHQVGEAAVNRAGPHLNGIFGRRAGALDGFKYSKAMQRAFGDGLVWDVEQLDAYIENPRALISGTRMSFRGLKDAQERHDVVAFLRQYSDNPQDIPESAPTAAAREVDLAPEILAIVGDAEYGEYLSSECLTCHQPDGADAGIPSIVYWPEDDFVVAMHAYKQKLRPHPVMQMMAARLSDEEIAALAAYFASIE